MSFAARLVHRLTIERATASTADEYGQPTRTWAATAEVRGFLEPKDPAREGRLGSDAGPVQADHTIFLLPSVDIAESDRIRYQGRVLEVRSVRFYNFGRSPHKEVDAELLTPQNTLVSASAASGTGGAHGT